MLTTKSGIELFCWIFSGRKGCLFVFYCGSIREEELRELRGIWGIPEGDRRPLENPRKVCETRGELRGYIDIREISYCLRLPGKLLEHLDGLDRF